MNYKLCKQLGLPYGTTPDGRRVKICAKCERYYEFNSNSQKYCSDCKGLVRKEKSPKWQRKYYQENKEELSGKRRAYHKTEKGKEIAKMTKAKMKELYPVKFKARDKVKYALRKGKLVKPSKCELCNEESKLEGHHKDYEKPLDVDWYCNRCHNLIEMGLSELVEACGEKFDYLKQTDSGKWRVFVKHGIDNYKADECDTPEEAVAKLWIELNK